jgi:hypothetical protein
MDDKQLQFKEDQEELQRNTKEMQTRGFQLADRFGIPRGKLHQAPATLWPVLFFEKLIDAVEHLEDAVYGERQGSRTKGTKGEGGAGQEEGKIQ